MIDLADIPPLHGPRPDGAPRVRRRAAPDRSTGRRAILGSFMAAGGSLGLSALGVFPAARKALAEGYSVAEYYSILQRCPSYAANHNCSPGCGPSRVCPDCCRTGSYRKGFHKSGTSHPGRYKLRPNQCYPGGWDGWRWTYARRCGRCARGVSWRCHDGWKKAPNGSWYKTICRWAVVCNN